MLFFFFSSNKASLSCGSEETVPTFVPWRFTGFVPTRLLSNGLLRLCSHMFALVQHRNKRAFPSKKLSVWFFWWFGRQSSPPTFKRFAQRRVWKPLIASFVQTICQFSNLVKMESGHRARWAGGACMIWYPYDQHVSATLSLCVNVCASLRVFLAKVWMCGGCSYVI